MTDDGEDFEVPDFGDMIAAMDQIKAQAPQLAEVLWAHYLELLKQGFTGQQALWVSAAYIMQNPGTPPE